MITKKLLSPTYVEEGGLSPKLKAYANTMQYFLWLDFCTISPSFAKLFPWGEDSISLLQNYYGVLSRNNWINLINLAKIIHNITGDITCPQEFIISSCYRWVKKDYSENKVICLYTVFNRNILIVGKKSNDPNYACKVSQIHLNKEIFTNNEHFYKCAFLTGDQKFSVSLLKDISIYE